MTPVYWDRIKRIFSSAVSAPKQERSADVRSASLLDVRQNSPNAFLEQGHVFEAPWLFNERDVVAHRFSVTRRIARGAMGEVYQVYDERLRLSVALKAIRPELVGDGETAERFRREVLVTREIAHEGLCRVFDLVEHEATAESGLPRGSVIPCLTMQLLEGQTMEEWLATRRPIATSEALPLLKQIAEALQVLHDEGIVHRDLKPSNVMLVASDAGIRAVLTDFGLAKPLDQSIFETEARMQGGTPYFMAPELLRGERPSYASDVYAFGLVIDELVTSTRAFPSDSLHDLLLQKLGDGPSRPSNRSRAISSTWDRTILRCLAMNPRHRFPNPQAVVAALSTPRRWRPWESWFLPRVSSDARPRWRVAGYTAATAGVMTGAFLIAGPVQGTSPKSVVVANFANLTNKPEFAYLAAGTAGELARRLSRVPDLRVYRQTDPTTPIPDSQRPMFTLNGDVQEATSVLRITVQVTDTLQGTVLWSQRFDGPKERSLELEDELATDTVAALVRMPRAGENGPFNRAAAFVGRILAVRGSQIPSSGTTNSIAFDAYLRGRVLFEERTLPAALQAIDYLKRAVDLDPRFAAAYSTLADVHGVLMDLHYAPHDTLISQVERYAEQAVALDPDLPEAQLSLAALRQMQWRWSEADAAYRRAIELHPRFARAYRWYGGLLLQFGQFEESLALYRRGLELDLYDYPSQSAYGHALFHAGRVSEAASHLERLLSQKDFFYAHALLGQAYAYLAADPAQRDEYLRKALDRSQILREKETAANGSSAVTEYADLVGALAWSYYGDPRSAASYIHRLETGRAAGEVSPSILARVYAAQRDSTRAIEALLQAEAQRDRELFYIAVSPYYASIRDEPQFRALIGRLHLSQ